MKKSTAKSEKVMPAEEGLTEEIAGMFEDIYVTMLTKMLMVLAESSKDLRVNKGKIQHIKNLLEEKDGSIDHAHLSEESRKKIFLATLDLYVEMKRNNISVKISDELLTFFSLGDNAKGFYMNLVHCLPSQE